MGSVWVANAIGPTEAGLLSITCLLLASPYSGLPNWRPASRFILYYLYYHFFILTNLNVFHCWTYNTKNTSKSAPVDLICQQYTTLHPTAGLLLKLSRVGPGQWLGTLPCVGCRLSNGTLNWCPDSEVIKDALALIVRVGMLTPFSRLNSQAVPHTITVT
jgi:hypothetical protein